MATNIPPGLKAIAKLIQQAKRLEKISPLMSYYGKKKTKKINHLLNKIFFIVFIF